MVQVVEARHNGLAGGGENHGLRRHDIAAGEAEREEQRAGGAELHEVAGGEAGQGGSQPRVGAVVQHRRGVVGAAHRNVARVVERGAVADVVGDAADDDRPLDVSAVVHADHKRVIGARLAVHDAGQGADDGAVRAGRPAGGAGSQNIASNAIHCQAIDRVRRSRQAHAAKHGAPRVLAAGVHLGDEGRQRGGGQQGGSGAGAELRRAGSGDDAAHVGVPRKRVRRDGI